MLEWALSHPYYMGARMQNSKRIRMVYEAGLARGQAKRIRSAVVSSRVTDMKEWAKRNRREQDKDQEESTT